MFTGPALTPPERAYLGLMALAAAIILLSDLALFWVLVAGWLRGRSLLSRRWSAAHVLVAFQAWLLPTLALSMMAGMAIALAAPDRKGALFLEQRYMLLLVSAYVLIQSTTMIAVVLFAVLVVYDQRPVAAGLSLRNWGPKTAIGLLAAAALIPVNAGLQHLSLLALRHAPLPALIERGSQEQAAALMGLLKGPAGLALGVLLIGVIGPFAKELFFRGFTYRCFRARWGAAVAIPASAALFAALHLSPGGLLSIFVLGCALAYLYERTGTLAASFTLHATNNIAAVLLAYFRHR